MSTAGELWHVPSELVSPPAEDPKATEGDRVEKVVVTTAVTEGTLILSVERNADAIVSAPSWDTLQVASDLHVRFGAKALKLNHAREPNTRIDTSNSESINLYALKDIGAGEALTFNYNTTEYCMADKFVDWMSGETVGGFSCASREEQELLVNGGLVAQHVLDMARKQEKDTGGESRPWLWRE